MERYLGLGEAVTIEPAEWERSGGAGLPVPDRVLNGSPGQPVALGEHVRVRLCRLREADAPEAAELLGRSVDFHRDLVTYPTDPAAVAQFIARSSSDGMLVFGIRHRSDHVLLGIATLGRISPEPWLTAECGAAVDVRHRGQGYMAAGMRQLVRFAIGDLGLHRVEALVRPDNARSGRMLASAGFRTEGVARGAIRIRGAWVDHMRWAITAEDLSIIRRETPVEERG
jgi:ribosomal-protein-alanine N-acetyltransferase